MNVDVRPVCGGCMRQIHRGEWCLQVGGGTATSAFSVMIPPVRYCHMNMACQKAWPVTHPVIEAS